MKNENENNKRKNGQKKKKMRMRIMKTMMRRKYIKNENKNN